MPTNHPTAEMIRLHKPHRKTLIRDYLFAKLTEAEARLCDAQAIALVDRSRGAMELVTYWDNVCAGIRWLLAGIEPAPNRSNRDNPP